MRTIRWSLSVAVLGLALVLLFYRLGDGSLYDWDEAIYAQTAREMRSTDGWGTLTWDGYPFFHKPPLYFWLTALTYKVIGVSEFAARLWPALFGFGVIALTFALGARFRSWAVGAASALLLLVVDPGYYSQWWNFLSLSRVAMLDVPFIFWLMVAQVLVWEAERRPWLLALLGLPVGLAVMTKAWVGFFAALLPFVYWLLTSNTRARHLGYWGVAALLACVVVLPWHLWQYGVHGDLFLQEYVEFNLVGRVFQVVEEHGRHPLFYLQTVGQGFSVWGYLAPLAYVWAAWRAWRYGDRWAWLVLVWVTVPLVLFSFAQTKIGWYISPIYPAIALLLGTALSDVLTDRVALGLVVVVMAVCCVRLPVPADGSPDVKAFAMPVAPLIRPDDPVRMIRQVCARDAPSLTAGALFAGELNTRASLRFYLNRPIGCLAEGEIRFGAPVTPTYVIADRETWLRLTPRGRVVIADDKYVLAWWE